MSRAHGSPNFRNLFHSSFHYWLHMSAAHEISLRVHFLEIEWQMNWAESRLHVIFGYILNDCFICIFCWDLVCTIRRLAMEYLAGTSQQDSCVTNIFIFIFCGIPFSGLSKIISISHSYSALSIWAFVLAHRYHWQSEMSNLLQAHSHIDTAIESIASTKIQRTTEWIWDRT